MKPNVFSLPLLLLLFHFLPLTSADYLPPMNCFSKSCGNVTDIRYPFWIRGVQPDYCGFPAFELTCKANVPILVMSLEDYQVKNIFYHNNSLVLTNVRILNRDCPFSYSNISFSLSPFNISSSNRELVFSYGCTKKEQLDYFEVPCAGNETSVYLGGKYSKPQQSSLGTACEASVMPVVGYQGANSSDYVKLLECGFLVEWIVANCTECSESRGQCGYSHANDNFMCICPDRIHYKSCTEPNRTIHTNRSKRTMIIAIASSVGAFFVICCVVALLYFRRKKQQRSKSANLLSQSTSSKLSFNNDPEASEVNYKTHIFSYDELQEATNGFDASRELGDGGFGTVYKGNLRDGRTVAVKRLYDHNYRRLEQFMNEVDILSPLRHTNLVTLYGCTSRRSRELLLVYEFVANGTVADHLHGSHVADKVLPWPIRLSIAIETADALAYLHAVDIIHRDVKTNNILLDNSFHVKVADFGLSRLFPLDVTHVSTAPQGTPGYVDPEYHQCYQLTDKSDVYSFGVVLVELISSKPAVDISRHRHEINLANLALNKIQNRELDQLIDPELGYQSDVEMKRMITQVAELAFRCLQLESDMRPSIKEVLEVLKGIENEGYKLEKNGDGAEGATIDKDESRLLKNISLHSPDSVTDRWASRSVTPSSSG